MIFRTAFILICCLSSFNNCGCKETGRKESDSISSDIFIDSIVVVKSDRTLTVFSKSVKIKTYLIGLGKNPVGKKQFEGDFKTPEGLYFIDDKSARSKYHKNLSVSYPNEADIKYAAAQNKTAGGEIKIHGLPIGYEEKNYKRYDWTWGCIALTNTEIDELYAHIKLGSPILILP